MKRILECLIGFNSVKGTGFSPYICIAIFTRALAPEGMARSGFTFPENRFGFE